MESLHRELPIRKISIQERSHRISVFQLFEVQDVEEVVVLVPRVSNSRYAKQRKHRDRPFQRTCGRDPNPSGFQILGVLSICNFSG
jgi:hypothetical protein